jgi:prevent-host-death family protein
MSETASGPARVGVRELRQNLSVYLDRVKEGETLEVTEHGHAVALLTPLPRSTMSTLDRLIAEGRVTPGSGDLVAYLRSRQPARAPALSPEPPTTTAQTDTGPTMAEILRQMQDEGVR